MSKNNPETRKKYLLKNREKLLKQMKEYKLKNKKAIQEYNKKYKIKNRKEISDYNKKYRLNNPEIIKECKKRFKQKYRIVESLRQRIRKILKSNDLKKNSKSLELIGCDVLTLKLHLQNQFKEGMTWENYGVKGWHIDHIKPCSSFDLTDPIQQKKCFHYTNLQPLWWFDNISKRDKLF